MKGLLGSLLLISLLSGCAATSLTPSRPLLKTPEMERSFQEGEKLFYARRFKEAESSYRSFLTHFPMNLLTAKTYFRIGEINFNENDFRRALSFYRKSVERGIDPEWGSQAIYKQAVCFFKLGEFRKIPSALDQLPSVLPDATIGLRAGSLRVSAAKKVPDTLEEERGYLELVDAYEVVPNSDTQVGDLNWIVSEKTARGEVHQWTALEKDEATAREINRLKDWVPHFQGKTSGGTLSWKIARLYHQKGDYQNAALWARQYLEGYPKHEYAALARALLEEAGKREEIPQATNRSSVGVLLPLSGKFAVYGESVLHGLECAAGIFAPCHGDLGINLIIRDTEGDPKSAAKIVEEFSNNREILAVVGPLPQLEVDQAVVVAEQGGLPMITLSQKPDVAKQGQFIFRNFLTVADQVATVVNYACGERHWKRFAVMTPQGAGGDEYRKDFEEEVSRCGGQVVANASYPEGAKNLTEAVRTLKFSSAQQKADEKVPFEALFFPDVYRRVPELLATLKFLNIEGLHLLGGAGWDHPGLIGNGTEGLEGSIFVDGFYPKSSNYATRDFVATFQSAYGFEPTLLEAYAFDSLRLLGSVIREHPGATRADLQKVLAQKRNFSGVTGNISFDEDGDARRRLVILTVDQGAIKEVQ